MRDFDRSARFWLRAYPRDWREHRGDEVAAVLQDLAADDARRVDARTAWSLVRGGVATRWRQTPPARVYLPYRLLDVRMPAQYREWVRRDIESPGHLRRTIAWGSWMFVLPIWVGLDTRGWETVAMWSVVAVVALASALSVRPGGRRRAKLLHHLRPRSRQERDLGAFVWVRAPRLRIAAEPGARVLVLVLAVGATAWSAVVLRDVGAGLLAVALGVGVALAAVVARRFRRHVPDRPAQPSRTLVGLAPHTRAALVLWCGLILAEAAAEATGAWPVSISVALAPVCLALLPSAVVAWRRARTTPGLAMVDLRDVAWTGRPIEVDRLDDELVPAPALEVR